MEENLENLIEQYYDFKNRADNLKKEAELYNKDIKDNFNTLGINEYSTKSGFVAKMTIQNRETFKEDALVEELIKLHYHDLIDLVPTINYDKLEDAIYNGKIDAKLLTPFKEVKQVVTLKVTPKKGE